MGFKKTHVCEKIKNYDVIFVWFEMQYLVKYQEGTDEGEEEGREG